jgi:glycosyltransferase involved in cell wall biosynthesis
MVGPQHHRSAAQPRARRRVLVVGHAAGMQLYGAERSLLDVLDGFRTIGIDAVVAIPATANAAYLAELASRSVGVHQFPVPAGWPRRPIEETTVDAIVELIRDHQVDAVHVNTIVPVDALLAATRCGVPAVVHAREIPYDDPALWEGLGVAGPAELIEPVLALATHVIAASRATAAVYPLRGATSVVPNVFDASRFDQLERDTTRRVRIALIGGTTARKGLLDFVEIARRLEHHVDATFVVVGQASELVEKLLAAGGLPSNLEFVGYVPTPEDAIQQADVVVNLSNCREAFGRTIVEAMAAGLPVVGYARGGTPELIRDGETGYLVTPGDIDTAAERLSRLVGDPSLRSAMGAAGKEIALERFSPAALADALASSYRSILPSAAALEQSAGDIRIALPTGNRTEFHEPFYVGNRARLAHCTSVRFLDESHLVTASLLGRELYLVRVDLASGTGEVVQSIVTTAGERDVSVDLLDVDGVGRVVTANCEASSVSLYRTNIDGLRYERSFAIDPATNPYCHGAAFVPGRPELVCAAITTVVPRVEFIDVEGGPRPPAFVQDGWLPKALAFVDGRLLVASVRRNVGQDPRMGHTAQVALVALDEGTGAHRILDTCELPGSSVDSCHAHSSSVYVSDQMNDAVLVFDIVDDRLCRRPDLLGFSFPHDAALSPSGTLLAVANYGPNEVRVRRLQPVTAPGGLSASPAGSAAARHGARRWSPPRLARGRGWSRSGRRDR